MIKNKERLFVIDILRVVSVLVIFLFHSNIHLGCQYGVFTDFIYMGAVFMTAFFILSGFLLFYVNYDKNGFKAIEDILLFYKKRIVSIMPLYWFIVIIYPFWDVFINGNSVVKNLVLIPIEIFGLQSVFHSLFNYTHNSGTWFVSCILLCYIVFPFLYELVKNLQIYEKIICGIVLGLLLLYSPLLAVYFGIEGLYSNSFFRILEFCMGEILCSLWIDVSEKKFYRKFSNWYTFALCSILLIVGVSLLSKSSFFLGNFMLYSWVSLPCFCTLFFISAGMKTKYLQKVPFMKYLADISYAFFFAQLFVWKITRKCIFLIEKNNNIVRILISFCFCMIVAVFLHEVVEKPLQKLLKKYMRI